MANKLIFSVYNDPLTGTVIEPYIIKLLDDGKFSYTYKKVATENLANHEYNFTDAEKILVRYCTEAGHHNLAKIFNKKKLKDDDFLRDFVTDPKHKELLNEYISRRNHKVLSALKGQIVYLKEKASDHPAMIEKQILPEAAEVVYNFSRTAKGTYYYLTIKQGNVYLNLKNKSSRIICHSPCWILITDKIYHFDDETDAGKLLPFLSKPYITIEPRMEDSYYEKFVLKAVKHFEVHSMGFDIDDIGGEKGAMLKLVRDIDGNCAFNLVYTYDTITIAANEPEHILAELEKRNGTYRFKRLKRDELFESDIEMSLLDNGLKLKYGALYTPKDIAGDIGNLLDWARNNKEMLDKAGIKLRTDIEGQTYYTGAINLSFSVSKEENDWFDLYGIVEFEGYKIPFIKFKTNILRGIREYNLPNGHIAILPEEWFERYRPILAFAQAEGDALRMKKYHAPIAEEAMNGGHAINLKFQEFYKADKVKEFDLPANLQATLRPYQQNGYNWMRGLGTFNVGGCLADDMGLGKTVQVIALLLSLYEPHLKKAPKPLLPKPELQPVDFVEADLPDGQMNLFNTRNEVGNLKPQAAAVALPVIEEAAVTKRPTLVVMPPSLIYNWEKELTRFAPQLKVFKYVSSVRSKMLKPLYTSHIILTTYGVVRNDLEILGKIDFEYIVLDESQLIKNPDSQSYKAVKQLNSRHKLTLTGTPIENSLTDLWSQLSFTNPGLLGGFDMFRREFVLPIEKKNDEMARKRLKALINPFILRRTKDQVAKDLPPLTEKLFYCDMTEKQHELYEREKSHYRNIILQNIEQAGIEKSKMVIFQGLMKLRLIANHPAMTTVTSAEETHLEGMHHFGSGKFTEVTRMLESLRSENHKVLIFSQFVKHLNLFKDWFEEHKIPYSYLIGNTTNRKDVIEQFEGSSETKFFLISLKAGGVGLNLTSADYVFMLDPWWNPAVEAQAINRAHRIGQTKNVIAYKFICKGTIEEKIVQLQQRKSALAEDFINHNNPLSSLSTQEVADLFK